MTWGASGEYRSPVPGPSSARGVWDAGWLGVGQETLSLQVVCVHHRGPCVGMCLWFKRASGGMEPFLSSKATVGPEHGWCQCCGRHLGWWTEWASPLLCPYGVDSLVGVRPLWWDVSVQGSIQNLNGPWSWAAGQGGQSLRGASSRPSPLAVRQLQTIGRALEQVTRAGSQVARSPLPYDPVFDMAHLYGILWPQNL